MSAVIEARGLTKRYGPVTALDGVSFLLAPATVYLLAGPNGAGKSTLLRCLVGMARPTAGTITIRGRRFGELASPVHVVGACLDPIRLPALRSGHAHLRCIATAAGLPAKRADEVIELTGLGADAASRRAGGYSLGMRQRLALAAALLGDPAILVLDEPTVGLDLHGVAWLRHQLRQWARQGRTVLVASHSLTELSATVDRILALDQGRLVDDLAREDLIGSGDLQSALFRLLADGEAGTT